MNEIVIGHWHRVPHVEEVKPRYRWTMSGSAELSDDRRHVRVTIDGRTRVYDRQVQRLETAA